MSSSSLLSSNPSGNPDSVSATRKRKKKMEEGKPNPHIVSSIQWKSESQQQIYSSKLLYALQQVRLSRVSPPQKRVQDAAYRVLATSVKGRTRWSRAILASRRLNLKKFMKQNTIAKRHRKVMAMITTGNIRLQRKSKTNVSRLKSDDLPDFQRKARVLGKLIPGCQKQPSQVVLEEALDYIPALEMQVRAMSALVEMFSRTGSSTMVSNSVLGSNSTPPN